MKCNKCKSQDTTIISANQSELSIGCNECGHAFKASTPKTESKVNGQTVFYVIKFVSNGKYFDGYYGGDGSIHSDEQIVADFDMPYVHDPEHATEIVVGIDVRPTVEQVNQILGLIEGS
ncbi:hypothetical protein GZ77_09630 [Endozoicomonas montiporae]|uniref:Uncharacterized protein n=2 Tax=Endozoicomonas montiporae TaxID=1027273 RepID=A0A081N806_9GAMM|nr:hypothetical protein [Endozoicomonas montiporae]AMO55546.1 hypothetical protein EZMO1_1357 [Endozoicomonas montiporae CL-33]KEQ14579.1 hypothetical protein GZ77_09630 [Endozoicomonas montiporae]